MTKKTAAELDRDIAQAMRHQAKYSPPAGLKHGQQWPKDRRYLLVDDKTGKDMRPALDFEIDQIHRSRRGVVSLELRGGIYSVRLRDPDERFALVDRNGKILAESKTVAGAMSKAPNDRSYAAVRGEYTSEGSYWGLGHGRVAASRETGRWIIG